MRFNQLGFNLVTLNKIAINIKNVNKTARNERNTEGTAFNKHLNYCRTTENNVNSDYR